MDLQVIEACYSRQAKLEVLSSLCLDIGAEHVRGVMQHGDDGFVRRPILVVEVDPRLIAPDRIPCYRFDNCALFGNLSALWHGAGIARLVRRGQVLRNRGRAAGRAESLEGIGAAILGLRLKPIKPAQLAGFQRQVLLLLVRVTVNRANSAPESEIDRETVGLAGNPFEEQPCRQPSVCGVIFDVLAWSWGVRNSGSTHQGGGAGAGKVNTTLSLLGIRCTSGL